MTVSFVSVPVYNTPFELVIPFGPIETQTI